MNIVTISGILCKNVDIRVVNGEKGPNKVCNFSIYIGKHIINNEKKSLYLKCVAWGEEKVDKIEGKIAASLEAEKGIKIILNGYLKPFLNKDKEVIYGIMVTAIE